MRHNMEHSSGICTNTQRKEHKPKLADRGISEDFLNVVLPDSYCSCNNSSSQTNDSYNMQCERSEAIKYVAPCYHIDAGSNHCSGMYERRHRCGTSHRIR